MLRLLSPFLGTYTQAIRSTAAAWSSSNRGASLAVLRIGRSTALRGADAGLAEAEELLSVLWQQPAQELLRLQQAEGCRGRQQMMVQQAAEAAAGC